METKKIFSTSRYISCSNSKGTLVRGTLMHLSGQSVVFEVYNPFSLLQLSEVLGSFEIHLNERTIYSGRAVVSSLVNTGIILVAQVTLVDPWNDLDILSVLNDKSILTNEVDRFLINWQSQNEIDPDFKVLSNDFQVFLSDLSLWLQQIEISIENEDINAAKTIRNDLVYQVANPIRHKIKEFLEKLEFLAKNKIPPELSDIHKSHIRRGVHPFLLSSPFVYRTFSKPLGYAGDYEMINMLLGDPLKGETIFSKTVNVLVLEADVAEAHRNRIKVLTQFLCEESKKKLTKNCPCKILNIACGPSREVVKFITHHEESAKCNITLIDFEKKALDFAKKEITETCEKLHSTIQTQFIEKSIDILLREAISPRDAGSNDQVEKYDILYCAGLFDYLTDSVCQRLISLFFSKLNDNGVMMVTNVHPNNPQKYFMEYLLEWNIFVRDEQELKSLNITGGASEVFVDDTGVNIFLKIRNKMI